MINAKIKYQDYKFLSTPSLEMPIKIKWGIFIFTTINDKGEEVQLTAPIHEFKNIEFESNEEEAEKTRKFFRETILPNLK